MDQPISLRDLPPHIPCPTCGRYKNRRLAVDALIIQNNKILLIKRSKDPFKNTWALPGGGVDYNETVEESLAKEIKEEVGLDIKAVHFLHIYSDPKRDPYQVITLSYNVETRGKPKAGSDAKIYTFFAFDDLPDRMAFDHKQIIRDYLKER